MEGWTEVDGVASSDVERDHQTCEADVGRQNVKEEMRVREGPSLALHATHSSDGSSFVLSERMRPAIWGDWDVGDCDREPFVEHDFAHDSEELTRRDHC